ncbi:hypothetical protein OS493_030337 [Desmophyllum pertusum]|uniref:Uncharacterized protein n=1 Tax=Desmophyllum pertusum TaxID=174260 RepID=A0A9W9ZKG7_9CNID|nr:hypothetical protein OS493_030337 [Desmophyllum pertusum]
MKQYDPQAKRWRPVTYRTRTLTDTETRLSQLEKEVKVMYLYGLRDTDHKPLFASPRRGEETNEAGYNSRHPEPSAAQDTIAGNQAEWTASDAEEVFEKNIRTVVQA